MCARLGEKKSKSMTPILLEKGFLYAFTNAHKGNAEGNAVEKKIRDQYSALTIVKGYSTTEVCREEDNKKPIWFVISVPLSNRLLTVRVVPMTEENLAFAFRVHNWNKDDMGSFGMIHCGCYGGGMKALR